MWNSRGLTLAVALLGLPALAQERMQGFAVERLYQSAPGGGWMVMDDLSLRGGLGGALSLSVGYAHHPLELAPADGAPSLPVISHAVLADLGGAITYGRFRVYFNLSSPMYVSGQSGVAGAYQYTGAVANLETNPDLISDARVGFDALAFGAPDGPFRLGASAQLSIPSGSQDAYVTDGTFRAMGRLLFAGDVSRFSWAAQLGVHLRPRDDTPVPIGPKGSELLFGLAAGVRWPVAGGTYCLVIGPEVFGETALKSLFGAGASGLEALLGARLEGIGEGGLKLRVKLGVGAGLIPAFGAPEWRVIAAVETFDRAADRDGDLVPDSRDACPDTPGVGGRDPKSNGCPESKEPRP